MSKFDILDITTNVILFNLQTKEIEIFYVCYFFYWKRML